MSVKAAGLKVDSTHAGAKINNGKWKLQNVGSSTGNCYMRIWSSDASSDIDTNVVATSQAVDMSTISSSASEYVIFNFDSEQTLADGYVVGVFTKDITDGTGSKYLSVISSNWSGLWILFKSLVPIKSGYWKNISRLRFTEKR